MSKNPTQALLFFLESACRFTYHLPKLSDAGHRKTDVLATILKQEKRHDEAARLKGRHCNIPESNNSSYQARAICLCQSLCEAPKHFA